MVPLIIAGILYLSLRVRSLHRELRGAEGALRGPLVRPRRPVIRFRTWSWRSCKISEKRKQPSRSPAIRGSSQTRVADLKLGTTEP